MVGDVTVVTAAPEPQAKNVADLTVDVVQCFTRHPLYFFNSLPGRDGREPRTREAYEVSRPRQLRGPGYLRPAES